MRAEAWSGERIFLLHRLWKEGLTAEAIGARLGGMSRSAVLGKVFRLRLRGETGTGTTAAQHDTLAPDRIESVLPSRRRKRQPRRREPPPAPAVVSHHKTLLELTNHTCRWPHGRPGTAKFFFCGAPGADLEQGIPYCARHMERAYRPNARVEKATAIAGGKLKAGSGAVA